MQISQIPTLLSLSLFFFIFSFISLFLAVNIQGFQPLPAPISGDDAQIQPPLSAQPPDFVDGVGSTSDEAIAPSQSDGVGESDSDIPAIAPAAEGLLKWCAVREEVEECNFVTDVINQLMEYTWTWYLCPQGGCREINGYPGDCSLGSVPANVIMALNSIPNSKRLLVLRTLTNTTLMDALYNGKNDLGHMFSPSTQRLAIVRKLTRLYLGKSASISQSIQYSVSSEDLASSSTTNKVSDETSSSSCIHSLQATVMFSVLMLPLILGVFTPI